MSLVPSSHSAVPSLFNLRAALAPLKAALDERDGWEILAAADEAKQMAVKPAAPRAAVKAVGQRSGGGGRGSRGDWPPMKSPRIPRSVTRQIYFRKETINSVIAVTTATNYTAFVPINLGLCPAATNLTAVFDLYRIVRVRYTVRNFYYPANGSAVPFVLLVPEFTGAAPSPASCQDYPGLKQKVLMTGQNISMTQTPRFLDSVQGPTFTGSEVGWLNGTTTSTPHYAISVAINAVNASLEGCLEMWIAFANGD
jgi:hypothetical protein